MRDISGKNNPFYGKKHSPEVMKKLSKTWFKKNDPRIYEYNKKRRSYKGKNNPNYGKKHTIETRKKIIEILSRPEIKERIKKSRALQILPLINTSIETKIESFLKKLSINYYHHYPIRDIVHSYCCDFFIPEANLIIECDGDYWHGNPRFFPILRETQIKQKERDSFRNKELTERGYKLIRLWEYEIRTMDLESFKKLLELKLRLQLD